MTTANIFKDKNVLVTGGTGMIGRPLVRLLLEKGAKVKIVSLDDQNRVETGADFEYADITEFSTCLRITTNMDYVFHLAGVKGSPAMCKNQPADFFVPMLQFNTNMMEAARRNNVAWYLYTSSVGVYSPAEIFYEDSVWETFPSKNDWFAGWAKRMGELQADAYKIQYNWNKVSIVRPANVYGPYDNFDPKNAMVIPALIRRAFEGENPLVVWGDGSAIRDFIYTDDVARGMLFAVENQISEPINLGSGEGISIRQIVDSIVQNVYPKPRIVWDTSKTTGDAIRRFSMERAHNYGFKPSISLEEGIKRTIKWFKENKDIIDKRYNVFNAN